MTFAGSVSRMTACVAASLPVLRSTIVYSSTSPGRAGAPFTSVTDLVNPPPSITGAYMSMAKNAAAAQYASPFVVKVSVCELEPPGRMPVTRMRSASRPSWFT